MAASSGLCIAFDRRFADVSPSSVDRGGPPSVRRRREPTGRTGGVAAVAARDRRSAVRRRGEDDFAILVRPFLGELVRVARRQLGCDHLAWEAVQEALLGLWSRPEVPANPRAWLIRAVLFRSLHLRRMIRRRHKHEDAACSIRRESSDDADPSQAVVVAELRSEVRRAIAKLNANHRDVLSLHVIDGLDYESIGVRLGVPIGTVRSRLFRAREALKSQLAPGFQERT